MFMARKVETLRWVGDETGYLVLIDQTRLPTELVEIECRTVESVWEAIKQLIDTFTVQFIAFVLPGKWAFDEFLKNATVGYFFKLMVALALIPVIYFLHNLIHKYIKTAEEEGVKN